MEIRPEVKLFAEAMEKVLRENDDKSGWKECSPAWLLIMLEEKQRELCCSDVDSCCIGCRCRKGCRG